MGGDNLHPAIEDPLKTADFAFDRHCIPGLRAVEIIKFAV